METFDLFRPDAEGWELLGSELKFESPYLAVHRERIVAPPSREPLDWTVVRRKFAIVVAPLTKEGKFLLVKQARIPVRKTLWEFPAGQVDDTVVSRDILLETLRRELKEETGYALGADSNVRSMGYYFSSQGFTDEHAYLFLASGVEPDGDAAPEESERIVECATFEPKQLLEMIATNEIRDANTLAAFARMQALEIYPA